MEENHSENTFENSIKLVDILDSVIFGDSTNTSNLNAEFDLFNNTEGTNFSFGIKATDIKSTPNSNINFFRFGFVITIVLLLIYSLVFIFGVVSNSVLFLHYGRRSETRSTANIFVMNLSIADFFVILFCVPFTCILHIIKPWILGEFLCKAFFYLQGVSVATSTFGVTVMSLDRWWAVHQPLRRLSPGKAITCCLLAWMTSLLIFIPRCFTFHSIKLDDGLQQCSEKWEFVHQKTIFFLLGNFLFCFIVPLIVTAASNIAVCWNLSIRAVVNTSSSNSWQVVKRNELTYREVCRSLMLVTVSYFFTRLPHYMLHIIKIIADDSEGRNELIENFIPFTLLLSNIQSCIAPVYFILKNKLLRQQFKSMFPKWVLSKFNAEIELMEMQAV